MSPNLVFQQVISHHKSRLSPSMSISTLEASTADSQSMVNGKYFFSYIEMDLCNQYLIPTIYALAAAKQVGLNAQCNCLPPFQPYQPLQSEESEDSLVPSVSHLRWARFLPEWRRTWSGVGAESTKGKWAEQLGRRWGKSQCSASAWGWWWRFFVVEILFYSILFLQKKRLRNRWSWNVNSSRFPVDEYTRCHILYSPPIYESKFGVPTSDFTPQKQTMSISTLEASTIPWLIRNQWSMVYNYFSYIEMDLYNQYLIPTIYTLAAAKQVGLNCFPPNSTPSATAFHRSNPTNLFSLRSLRILWFLRFPIFAGLVFFLNGEGLDLESVQSQQKESGRSNWATGGKKKPMLSQCLRLVVKVFCGWDTILFFFPCINRFVIAFLRM